ncbi:hypothetical protein EDD99_8131 [Streptomyces sp. 846.5]|nr:hypothetical protein EDD99_8131 [Streptomyces sp. 846.5]
MTDGGTPPPESPEKGKRVHLQVGDHLDLNLVLYLSPKAFALLGTVCASIGGSFWGSYFLSK